VQFFATGRDAASIRVIEINTRYGGGYPLSWEAGARYPRWTLEELLGQPTTAAPDQWRDGLTMLRYDDAVFVDAAEVGL
jgi:carbamoyl-phosphate synthase large subunit